MNHSYEKSFPLNAKDYEIYEEVGEGVSATVYRALCIPLNVAVAVKVLDLERCNNDSVLAGVRREVQTMSSLDHPNVLRSYCSFTDEHKLWVVMPYMSGGSCLHIMKSTHPEGFEETVIATLLYEVLKALAYLHAHGYIHRDVKAGNILIDSNGAVKLGDFGVSAYMFDTGDRQRSRNTFVGTPCWMAPEVMHQLHGYDFKADIWSFGITALELARGHAPFSKYPPMKVLLMTLQNAPPGLDYKSDKKFSKYFRSLVAACLVKDPKKRPSSEKLLKHRFFQKARSIDFVSKTLLNGLTPLGDRFRTLKDKEADLLVQNKAICGDKDILSQQEYIRGISAWNFNLEDLKSEASISQDYEGIPNTEDPELYCKQKDGCDEKPSLGRVDSFITPRMEARLNDLQSMDSSSASEPISPVEEPKEQAKPKSQLERNSSSVGDTAEGTIIRRKGRFKVTSEELSPKGNAPNNTANQVSESSTGNTTSNVLVTAVLPLLQSILQQNNMQKETLLKLIKSVEELTETSTCEPSQMSSSSAREKELLTLVGHLQQNNDYLAKELQRMKAENAQRESQINELANKEEEGKPLQRESQINELANKEEEGKPKENGD